MSKSRKRRGQEVPSRAANRASAARVANAVRWALFGILGMVLIFVLFVAITDPTSDQPERTAATEVSITPRDPEAYRRGVVFEFSSGVVEDRMSLAERAGVVARAPILQTDLEILVPWRDPMRNLGWEISLSADADVATFTQSCEQKGDYFDCGKSDWVHLPAGQKITAPVIFGHPRDPENFAKDFVPVYLHLWIKFTSLAKSFEFDGDTRVTYNGLALARDTVLGSLDLRQAPDGLDILAAENAYNELDLLREDSKHGAGRSLWICPSCQPLHAYICATQTQKDQYLCWGGVGSRIEAAWTTPSYPWSWVMPVFWQTITGVVVSAVGIFVLGTVIAKLRTQSEVLSILVPPSEDEAQ